MDRELLGVLARLGDLIQGIREELVKIEEAIRDCN